MARARTSLTPPRSTGDEIVNATEKITLIRAVARVLAEVRFVFVETVTVDRGQLARHSGLPRTLRGGSQAARASGVLCPARQAGRPWGSVGRGAATGARVGAILASAESLSE